MKAVSQEVIDGTLSAFPPGFGYLRDIAIDYPRAWARFVLGERELVEETDHVVRNEIERCVVQFLYAYFGHVISEGRSEVFRDLSFEEYRKVMVNRLVMRKSERISFQDKLEGTDFYGRFELKNPREYESANIHGSDCRAYAEDFDFSFYDGKCFGRAGFVFYLENAPD
jgi:hypothetical protein